MSIIVSKPRTNAVFYCLIVIVFAITWIVLGLGYEGYLGPWFGAGETAVARATAPSVAEAGIKDLAKSDDELAAKARKCRVESRLLRRECDDLREEVDEKRMAINSLALAAKKCGLPAIKEGLVLTDEEKNKSLVFNNKVVNGAGVYRLLDAWLADVEEAEQLIESEYATATRLANVAEKIENKRLEIRAEIGLLQNRLKDLAASRDRATAEKIVAELEANVNGINTGRVGKALSTIEDEIRHLEAQCDELSKDVLPNVFPKDVLAKNSSGRYEQLQELWSNVD